jgi:DNA-binding MarR family transcriptional regulator
MIIFSKRQEEELAQMEAKLIKGISEEEMKIFYSVINKIKKNLE